MIFFNEIPELFALMKSRLLEITSKFFIFSGNWRKKGNFSCEFFRLPRNFPPCRALVWYEELWSDVVDLFVKHLSLLDHRPTTCGPAITYTDSCPDSFYDGVLSLSQVDERAIAHVAQHFMRENESNLRNTRFTQINIGIWKMRWTSVVASSWYRSTTVIQVALDWNFLSMATTL